MQNVVGIHFQHSGKMEYYAPQNFDLGLGDWVVVESKRGLEVGRVKYEPLNVADEDVALPLKQIVRKATEKDIMQYEQNEYDAKDALKVIFNFTSDERVDFRKLVKVLAQKLRTRIELRQIGVRDEAKLLGGIGPCGRSLCCSTFLGDFEPVSIKMAKDQNLSLNPSKISGACGRLMCCLKYENDYYEEARAQLPDVGDVIETPEGNGKVVGLNILDISMQVKVEGLEQPLEYKMEELETLK